MNGQDIANLLFSEINQIEQLFENEIAIWGAKKFKCELVILGEAPLSPSQFFYNSPRNYLSFLKNHYTNWNVNGSTPSDFLSFLRQKGILNLDIYKFPLPTSFYDTDSNLYLFDEKYLTNKIDKLTSLGIIDNNTKFIYRYKKLLIRGLNVREPLNLLNKNLHIQLPIAIGANAANINPQIIQYLP